MRVLVVPVTQKGKEQKALELVRQKAVDLKTVYLARRYRRISDAYKEGRLDDASYLRAKKGAEADAASVEKSFLRFVEDIKKLKGYRNTEIISDLAGATLGFLRGKNSFDDSLSIGEAGGYANRQSRDAIHAAWNRNMGKHGMILYAINPKEGGLFSYTLSPDNIHEKILQGKIPPADIVAPRPQETGGRIADFVITRKIEKLGNQELEQAPIAAVEPLPAIVKEMKLKLETKEKVDENSYLPGVFADGYRVPSARADKVVSGSLLEMGVIERALILNGMQSEVDRIEAITPTSESYHGTTAKNMRMDALSVALTGLTHDKLANRYCGAQLDLAEQAAYYTFSKMGLHVAATATQDFNPQMGMFYGADVGNGFRLAGFALRAPVTVTGEQGQKVQFDSDWPFFGFGLSYEKELGSGFRFAAIGIGMGKPDKAITLSKIDFDRGSQKVPVQLYMRNGTTGKPVTGVLGGEFELQYVTSVGGRKLGVKAGGNVYSSVEMQKDPESYRWSREVIMRPGFDVGVSFENPSVAGIRLGFKMTHEIKGAADAYYTLFRTDDVALSAFAKYAMTYQHNGPGGWEQSMDIGLRQQGGAFDLSAGRKQYINPTMPGLRDPKFTSNYYLNLGVKLF